MVLLSYLELLVNTRSELALARVLNVPNRDLTHEAFTELKREAKKKNMTMYQVIFIFVRLISLICFFTKMYTTDFKTFIF
jgi:superfamily I DNA/RNA helicase